jgi:hypothetical protein
MKLAFLIIGSVCLSIFSFGIFRQIKWPEKETNQVKMFIWGVLTLIGLAFGFCL